jgi:hypothetical protein
MQHLCMDVEVYPNFVLVGLLFPGRNASRRIFSSEDGIGEDFTAFRGWYAERGKSYLWIGFNSFGYDNHIVGRILLEGVDDPAAHCVFSTALIESKDWRRSQTSAAGELAIDVFALNGGAKASVGSLKQLACKLDAHSLRELPYPPDRKLTHDEMIAVAEYNKIDLDVTALVAATQADKIEARLALAREYRLRRVIAAHDAKLAESILAKQLFGDDRPTYPTVQTWTLPGRKITEKFSYRNAALQDMLTRIPELMRFEVISTETDDGYEKQITGVEIIDSVKVGDNTYVVGVGGLHSDDQPALFIADDRFTLLDLDVDSFYPAIIINHRLVPAHLPDTFLAEFDALRKKRLEAKAAGKTALADGLKIAINSVFGKTRSAYSWLADPTVTIQTTLLGQLTLLWFIDALDGAEGIEILSANTDGITIKARRDLTDWIKAEMNRAAAQLSLTLSWTEYRLIARRDINNFIAASRRRDTDVQGRVRT